MAEITLLILIERGIGVITSYFSNYINDYVLGSIKDFELLIVVPQIIFLWMSAKKIMIYIIDKIWTYRKYAVWRKVVIHSFDFVSLMLILLVFQIFFEKLAEARKDANLNIMETLVTLYVVILLIYLLYEKARKYSNIK
jgi:hypothetical protein